MRIAVATCVIVVASNAAPISAQTSSSFVSVEAVAEGLQKPHPLIVPPAYPWVPPPNRRLGFLTLVPPDTNGEIVKVAVPVGELAARLARRISAARHQGRERKARAAVERDLREFLARQAK